MDKGFCEKTGLSMIKPQHFLSLAMWHVGKLPSETSLLGQKCRIQIFCPDHSCNYPVEL
jgi:hypothetical protein